MKMINKSFSAALVFASILSVYFMSHYAYNRRQACFEITDEVVLASRLNEGLSVESEDKDELDVLNEFRLAVAEFKSKPGFREDSAQELLPHLKHGMTSNEVINLLGEPSSKERNGAKWRYCVFYSKAINVYFNSHGKVERIAPIGVDRKRPPIRGSGQEQATPP